MIQLFLSPRRRLRKSCLDSALCLSDYVFHPTGYFFHCYFYFTRLSTARLSDRNHRV